MPVSTAVRVAGGPDIADRHIAEHAAPGHEPEFARPRY